MPRIFEGEGDISLQHILLPPLTFCSVCLSILLFIACLPARAKRGMAIIHYGPIQ